MERKPKGASSAWAPWAKRPETADGEEEVRAPLGDSPGLGAGGWLRVPLKAARSWAVASTDDADGGATLVLNRADGKRWAGADLARGGPGGSRCVGWTERRSDDYGGFRQTGWR